VGRCSSFDYCLYPSDGIRNCHENVESAHEKSKTYEQLAIFMLRGAPEAHDACCKIAITLIDPWAGVLSAMAWSGQLTVAAVHLMVMNAIDSAVCWITERI